MTGKNATPLLGWHPKSAELVAWFEAEVKRRGGGRGVRSAILEEALTDYMRKNEGSERSHDGQGQDARVPAPAHN